MLSILRESAIDANNHRVLGSIIVCASQTIAMLIVGRIINGLSVGVSLLDLFLCNNLNNKI
jgi:hypothetical protein